tara:strand:+ start:88 stop:273 length:186 start_codon:yes stop_codon:yes gene_type:complete
VIWDLEQPARIWLADLIDNCNAQLKNGNEPSVDIKIDGLTFQFSLKNWPGVYETTVCEVKK